MATVTYKYEYEVGEQPSDAITIPVLYDLTAYNSIYLDGPDEMPETWATFNVSDPYTVIINFLEPFTEAGEFPNQLFLRTPSSIDIPDLSIEFVVRGVDTEAPFLVVSPDQVYLATAQTVSDADIMRAQNIVGLYLNRDLSDEEWFNSLSMSDQKILMNMVAFTSTLPPVSTEELMQPSASSMSVGDVSISYSSGDYGWMAIYAKYLHPLALSLSARLSWLTGGTIYTTPFFDTYGGAMTAYTTSTAFSHPIVRGPQPEDWLWSLPYGGL